MLADETRISLFVRVNCEDVSQHRSPEGIYKVDVFAEQSPTHTASSAMQVVRDNVAFMRENEELLSMSVYDTDGNKLPFLACVDPIYSDMGSYQGRAESYPDGINLH